MSSGRKLSDCSGRCGQMKGLRLALMTERVGVTPYESGFTPISTREASEMS